MPDPVPQPPTKQRWPALQHWFALGHHTCPGPQLLEKRSTHCCVNWLHSCVSGQQFWKQPICVLVWQHTPVCVLPQNWLTLHTVVTPQAELPAGTHWLFTHTLPCGQHALLQRLSPWLQQTVFPKQTWPLLHTLLPHDVCPNARQRLFWHVLVDGQQPPPQNVAPWSQHIWPLAHCCGAGQMAPAQMDDPGAAQY